MSAIFGVLWFDGQPCDPGEIARMGAALDAHGPGGGGCIASGPAALGRRVMNIAGAIDAETRARGPRRWLLQLEPNDAIIRYRADV